MSPASPLTLVCLGDSLTGPSPVGSFYLDKYLKWSDLLQFGLDAAEGAAPGAGRVRVINRGLAGETTAGVRADLQARVLDLAPDIVVILLGANNFSPARVTAFASRCGAGAEAEEAAARGVREASEMRGVRDELRADLTDITRRLRAAGARVLLLCYPRPLADDMSRVWTHANAGNPDIAQVAQAEGLPLLPLAPAFAAAAARGLPVGALASPIDGIHLNPAGELEVARAVLARLRELQWV
ncbi:hypothetical protein DB346_19590 [Verrucomicrobia bacterium LW23]|nr:hypothetical protein DB346_19590 [Verrucomicrobia bacterium LW23]